MLAKGASAANALTVEVAFECFRHGLEIESMMECERLVFGGEHRKPGGGGYCRQINPLLT